MVTVTAPPAFPWDDSRLESWSEESKSPGFTFFLCKAIPVSFPSVSHLVGSQSPGGAGSPLDPVPLLPLGSFGLTAVRSVFLVRRGHGQTDCPPVSFPQELGESPSHPDGGLSKGV